MIWWMTAGGPAVAELGALLTDLYVTRATGGGLAVHEALGGHTIKEHVARGIIDLTSRLASNSKLKAASSFLDKETAGRAIAAGLRAEAGDIAQWLAGSDKVLSFTHDVGRTIGYTLDRGATQFRDVSAVRIVLQRDPRSSTGYLIKTAYPTP